MDENNRLIPYERLGVLEGSRDQGARSRTDVDGCHVDTMAQRGSSEKLGRPDTTIDDEWLLGPSPHT